MLDNLKVHQAKVLESVYDQNFKEMFLPPYSCELNPIERLWSVLKHKWAQNLFHFTEEVNTQVTKVDMHKEAVERLHEMLGKIKKKIQI